MISRLSKNHAFWNKSSGLDHALLGIVLDQLAEITLDGTRGRRAVLHHKAAHPALQIQI